MKTWIVTFFIGILLFYNLPSFPAAGWYLVLALLSLVFLFIKSTRFIAVMSFGFIWAFFRADMILTNQLPAELEGQSLVVSGRIVDLPHQYSKKQQFAFQVESIEDIQHDLVRPYLTKLSWYERSDTTSRPTVHVGERWQFTVRLKRPNGFMNRGGQDYEARLFQQGIHATGYIKHGIRLDAHPSHIMQRLHRWRAEIYDNINTSIVLSNGIIPALGLGLKDDISQAEWQVLRKTGTIHLMAISGLHISLVAALAFFIVRWLWSIPVITLHWLPAVKAGAVSAILAAFVYAALAGFSIPTQRALIMVTVVMLCLLSRRVLSGFDIFFIALLSVLLFSPAAVIAPGFWLSFAAVAIIFYSVAGRTGEHKLWRTSFKVHFLLALGLSPILLVLFGQNPILGPLANIIAVPFFTVLITPLVLLGLLSLGLYQPSGVWLLNLANYLTEQFWPILEFIAGLPFSSVSGNISSLIAVLLSLIGVALFLMPKGLPGRWLGFIFILPAFLVRTSTPAVDNYSLTLLDVGQGLAIVIRTNTYTLLYDTGAKFGENFDIGKLVVLPYLRASDISHLDKVIVSHSDNDHAGGYNAIAKEVSIEQTLSSTPEYFHNQTVDQCLAGQKWHWDGVDFEMLSPNHLLEADEGKAKSSDNNRSCVLKIDNGHRSVLLSGDIEAVIEARLVEKYQQGLDVDILIAPHHGSNTSSTVGFINATSPEYVLVSAGYRNRFNHPAEKVKIRYKQAGIKLLQTSNEGAISFAIGQTISKPILYRQNHSHFWNRNHVE